MEKNKSLNIIGFFRIPFQAISNTQDGCVIVHIYNQEASKIFYSGEFTPIAEHSMFIMQKMDGDRIISEAIPIRVVSVQEYTVDDKGFIKSLIMKVTEDIHYFDRTFTGASYSISPFGEYIQYEDAVAIIAYGYFKNKEDMNLFASNHPFINIDGQIYMFARLGKSVSIYSTVNENNVPYTEHFYHAITMIYTKKAAYNNMNTKLAENALEILLSKKY